MKRFCLFSVVALTVSALLSAPPASAAPSPKLVGYFIQWGMYARNFRVKQLQTTGEAARLTHLNYAFANVSNDYKCYEETRLGWGDASADYEVAYSADQSVDGLADDPTQPLRGHFNQLRKLKALYPNLKILISIGGFTWSGRFSDAALPENRAAFVQSCIDLFIRGNLPSGLVYAGGTPPPTSPPNQRAAGIFDGIDVDWEYPARPGFTGDPSRSLPPNVYRPEDTQNFTALLAEFRRQLDALGQETGKHYLLTIAAPAGDQYKQIELSKVHPYLDFINLMAYDMHGAWAAAGPTNFQAPLYLSPTDPSVGVERVSVDSVVSAYLAAGVPPEKLVLGVPYYGRGWTGVPDQNHGLYQSASTMKPAPATFEAGVEDYKKLKALNWPSFRDPATGAFWLFDGSTFWNYDDQQVIAAKAAYIKAKGLGGAMAWSLDSDDGTLTQALADGLK